MIREKKKKRKKKREEQFNRLLTQININMKKKKKTPSMIFAKFQAKTLLTNLANP